MWVMNRVAAAPCQCSSPGSKKTRSPGRMTSMAPPRRWASPTPSTTKIVWPFGCVCQAVRAPGVKWTLLAWTREPSAGAAMVSMNTAPVNQSAGPLAVFMLLPGTFISPLLRERSLGQVRDEPAPDGDLQACLVRPAQERAAQRVQLHRAAGRLVPLHRRFHRIVD